MLFCDLVDSTALAQRLDPEDFEEVIRRYQEVCAGVVARYDGRLFEFLGDGVLVHFGHPRAHEDDAERAVRAGLDLMDAVGKLALPAGATPRARVLSYATVMPTSPEIGGRSGDVMTSFVTRCGIAVMSLGSNGSSMGTGTPLCRYTFTGILLGVMEPGGAPLGYD